MLAGQGQAPASRPLPNSRRFKPSKLQDLRQYCLQLFEQQLFQPGFKALRQWEEALVSRLLRDATLSSRLAGQLALLETRQALTAYLERARSQDDLKRLCRRCLMATETALRLCTQWGWLGCVWAGASPRTLSASQQGAAGQSLGR